MGILQKTLEQIRKHAATSGTIIQKLKSVGPVGSRLTPARNTQNDTKVGGRLDFSSIFTGKDGRMYQNVNFQLNKNAQDSSIRALVEKYGSHQKYAETAVLMEDPVVSTKKVDGEGKEVPLSESEVEAAKVAEIEKRKEEMFRKLMEEAE